ncbi:hypothetical protein M422DRAFT_206908 [Sphaerobolus stellatus SS14]|uniref:GP-PDE domain-containing protein n=1 Tax=Sphaerobolus stellatus (strain SS14) TaxID=990650 RepID=A0A0C9VSW8_SPHS4|nr:hypothetical protein M422DRAFT_206908 [Sphaerobolus stellatus SS14]
MFPLTPLLALAVPIAVSGTPPQSVFGMRKYGNTRFFDIQAHRGGRANTIENTLPSFAWALIDGATTLELDNGITKDGVVVVWHDEEIVPFKCRDTGPASADDPSYPYVGKYVANLTLAQIKTLDCSVRQHNFPNQLTYPGTKIPTLQEFFEFLDCADPKHNILLNIESKVDAESAGRTHDVETFVRSQYELFASSYYYRAITYQSFDWRTLAAMKELDRSIITSVLVDDHTAGSENSTEGVSPWLAGLNLSNFNGSTLGERIVQAASFIGADIVSPQATSKLSPVLDADEDDYIPFTTYEMVRAAHQLGMLVKPWTVNRLSVADRLLRIGVDGIITDAPDILRRWAQQQKLPVAPRYPKYSVLACLEKYNQIN